MRVLLTSCTVIAATVIAAVGVAQPGPRGRGLGPSHYNPATVETGTGTVTQVQRITGKGRNAGVHFMLKTDAGTLPVHLGPSQYVDKQAVKIGMNDTVTVRGSRVTMNGAPAIIAAEVTKGDKTLKLRDEKGLPLWRGASRRRP